MIILRQKEYTSIFRKIGAKVGKVRRDWGFNLQKKIEDSSDKINDINNELIHDQGVNNKKLLKESIREGRDNYNARTISINTAYNSRMDSGPGSSNIGTKEVNENTGFTKKSKKLDNILKDNDNIIIHDTSYFDKKKGTSKSAKVEAHAHEVGHLKNTANKKWYVNRSQKARNRFGSGKDKNTGIIGRLIDNRVILKDEEDASKNAIEFLKKKGATKKELGKAKSVLDKSLDTYKEMARINRIRTFKDRVQIPSNRNVSTEDWEKKKLKRGIK